MEKLKLSLQLDAKVWSKIYDNLKGLIIASLSWKITFYDGYEETSNRQFFRDFYIASEFQCIDQILHNS